MNVEHKENGDTLTNVNVAVNTTINVNVGVEVELGYEEEGQEGSIIYQETNTLVGENQPGATVNS